MKWNNKDALELFLHYTHHLAKNQSRSQKCDEAASKCIENYLLPSSEFKLISTKFKRLIESKPGNKMSEEAIQTWEQSFFFEFIPPPPLDEKKKVGRPSLTLGDVPCVKKSRSILNEMVASVEEFAVEQNISKEDALTMIVDECYRSWHSSVPSKVCTVPDVDATALIYNVNLSIHQYQMIRTLCLPHGVVFPTRNRTDEIKKTYHPPITSYQLKSSVPITSLLDETATSLIKLNKSEEVGGTYHMVGKFGVDGSGSHKIRQQLINTSLATEETGHLDPTKCNSFILSCYCPLELRYSDTVIWTNPVPNSTSFARPVSLTRAAEEREILSIELEPSFEVIRGEYKTDLLLDGATFSVSCKTECSMIDGKMVSLLQGDSGAFCHLCHATRADANDPRIMADGFAITKDYATCKEAWDKLIAGDISYSSVERQGQCHENLVKADLHCFSVLHFKLRSLDFAQKILYHLVGGQKIWSETANLNVMRFLAIAKKECIDAIRESTGMLMDSPCGSGGNTNTGPLAGRYFCPSNRSKISDLILNEEDRENYCTFLSLTNMMLTITQSVNAKKVKIDELKSLGIELMLHMKNAFIDEKGNSWVMLIPSFHQMCAHSWELFHWNGGYSIAKWSESPVESWNKHVRSFQGGAACRSRQLSIKDNIYDIFRRMLIMSHPEIASKRPRPSCTICGEVGHTARSSRHKRANVSSEEQSRIDSMYY